MSPTEGGEGLFLCCQLKKALQGIYGNLEKTCWGAALVVGARHISHIQEIILDAPMLYEVTLRVGYQVINVF